MGSKKGFIHIVEVILIIIIMFLVIWQFTYIPGAKTEWSRTKLTLQGNDILFSLDRKGINWFDSEEVETEFNKAFNLTNILYDLKLKNVIKPRILVGCICDDTEFATANGILNPFVINGKWVNFTLDKIDPSDISEIYDVVLLWDFNLTGYKQVSSYLEADKGIVEVRDLNEEEINNFEVQKNLFGLRYNSSLPSPGIQSIAFTKSVSYANSTYYNIFKYFYHTPNSTGGLIEEPFLFPDFLGSNERVSPRDGDERRIILKQVGSNVSALIVNQGMGEGFGRTAWLSEGSMSEKMKVLIRDLVVWAAGDTYRVVPNKITNPVIFSLYKLFKPAGLVAQWDFDEGSGSTARDTSGNVNHGDINGAEWVDGRVGKALEFDGVDYVEVPDSPELRLGTKQTVEAWVNVNAYPSSWARFVGKGDAGSSRNYGLWIQNDGDILYQFQDSVAGIIRNIWNNAGPGDPANIPLGSGWHQVVGTFDGTIARLYIDGNEVNATDYSGSIPVTNAESLMIGARQSGNYFNGTIDQVRIYNRALSPEEVESLYDFPEQDMFQPAEVVLTLGYVY